MHCNHRQPATEVIIGQYQSEIAVMQWSSQSPVNSRPTTEYTWPLHRQSTYAATYGIIRKNRLELWIFMMRLIVTASIIKAGTFNVMNKICIFHPRKLPRMWLQAILKSSPDWTWLPSEARPRIFQTSTVPYYSPAIHNPTKSNPNPNYSHICIYTPN